MYQKCNGCNDRNETTYYRDDYDDVYCNECYKQNKIDDECYCDDDACVTCHHHE